MSKIKGNILKKEMAKYISDYVRNTYFSFIDEKEWGFADDKSAFGNWGFGPRVTLLQGKKVNCKERKLYFYISYSNGILLFGAENFPRHLAVRLKEIQEDVVKEFKEKTKEENFFYFIRSHSLKKVPVEAVGSEAEKLKNMLNQLASKNSEFIFHSSWYDPELKSPLGVIRMCRYGKTLVFHPELKFTKTKSYLVFRCQYLDEVEFTVETISDLWKLSVTDEEKLKKLT